MIREFSSEFTEENLDVKRGSKDFQIMFNEESDTRAEEPLELRTQNKSQIYNLLKSKFILPMKEARGVSRAYLVAVYENKVFRIERATLLHFEAGLTLEHQIKSGPINISTMVRRLDELQMQKKSVPLGFPEAGLPDEPWLWRVARVLDQSNLLGFFRKAVDGSIPPEIPCSRV